MHILFISEYYPPKIMGGGEINLQTIAHALAKENHTISILTAKFPHLPTHETLNNVHIYRTLKTGTTPNSLIQNLKRRIFFPPSIIKQTISLIRKLQKTNQPPIDIIHFIGPSIIAAKQLKRTLNNLYIHQYSKSFLEEFDKCYRVNQTPLKTHPKTKNIPLFATIESYPALCPKGDRFYKSKHACPHICTLQKFLICQQQSTEIGKIQNHWYLKYNPLFLFSIYHYYKQLNSSLQHCHLIAISAYVQTLLTQQQHQSIIIPNALDIKPFQNAAKQLTQKSDNIINNKKKPTLLYLGSLTAFKGPQIILQAIKNLNVHLDLYSDGSLKSELQTYITQHHIDATIHPPVAYTQIPQLYQHADIILFPSLWPEPFGRIPIEAHAAGKIVIASNSGAIPETISPNDFLVPPGDPQTLHNTIQKIIEEKIKKKSKPNTENLTQYQEKNIAHRLINAYQKEITSQKEIS